MVPEAGVEPARYRYHRILSPARLPIPSFRRKNRYIVSQNQPAVKSFFHLAVLFLRLRCYSSLQFSYPPAVRPLFHRRAGKGVPALQQKRKRTSENCGRQEKIFEKNIGSGRNIWFVDSLYCIVANVTGEQGNTTVRYIQQSSRPAVISVACPQGYLGTASGLRAPGLRRERPAVDKGLVHGAAHLIGTGRVGGFMAFLLRSLWYR